MEILLVVLLILLLCGGGWGWAYRADYGPAPYSLAGVLLVVVLALLVLRVL